MGRLPLLPVEAAHIYPKSESGPDHVRNGIALCRFHHCAFDSGWFGITDNFDIVIKSDSNFDIPTRVQTLNDTSIETPKESELAPHPKYLAEHRRLYGLE